LRLYAYSDTYNVHSPLHQDLTKCLDLQGIVHCYVEGSWILDAAAWRDCLLSGQNAEDLSESRGIQLESAWSLINTAAMYVDPSELGYISTDAWHHIYPVTNKVTQGGAWDSLILSLSCFHITSPPLLPSAPYRSYPPACHFLVVIPSCHLPPIDHTLRRATFWWLSPPAIYPL
jgi:hypothetical protein